MNQVPIKSEGASLTVRAQNSNEQNETPINQTGAITAESDEGLVAVVSEPGASCGLKIGDVETPNGKELSVILTETGTIPAPNHSFMNNVPLAATGLCWSDTQLTTVGTSQVYTPLFNDRTMYLMDLYKYYFCNAVFRIVCKIPLLTGQKFWVQSLPDSELADGISSVGFEWAPSETNEIFVTIPWINVNRTLASGTPFSDAVGLLSLTPITEMIGESPLPLDISVFVAPHAMRLFNPIT
eukprot:249571_1